MMERICMRNVEGTVRSVENQHMYNSIHSIKHSNTKTDIVSDTLKNNIQVLLLTFN